MDMEYNFERKIDDLGRVVLPADGLRMLSLRTGDRLLVQVDAEQQTLILKKERPACLICQRSEQLKVLPNHTWLCKTCISRLAQEEV